MRWRSLGRRIDRWCWRRKYGGWTSNHGQSRSRRQCRPTATCPGGGAATVVANTRPSQPPRRRRGVASPSSPGHDAEIIARGRVRRQDLLRRQKGVRLEQSRKRCWWTWPDSNRRPPRCERDALPTELQAQSRRAVAHWGIRVSILQAASALQPAHPAACSKPGGNHLLRESRANVGTSPRLVEVFAAHGVVYKVEGPPTVVTLSNIQIQASNHTQFASTCGRLGQYHHVAPPRVLASHESAKWKDH